MESDLFSSLDTNAYRKTERYFIEQYLLKMSYRTPMGYGYLPSQRFNIDREIDEDGFQSHRFDDTAEWCGFFSGSTGWGWGIPQKSQMIDYALAKRMGVNMRNYANVGVNLYKIYTLFEQLSIAGKLPKKNIVYFGINEGYDTANNRSLFTSMRDARIAKKIRHFENYYRNIAHDTGYLCYEAARSVALRVLDVKNAFGKGFVERMPAQKATKTLDEAVYRENFRIITEIVRRMRQRSPETIFVLEPSLFDKEHPTPYERKLLEKKRWSDNLLETTLTRLYDDLSLFFEKEGVVYVDARRSLDGVREPLYFDYCHPYTEASKMIGRFVGERIGGGMDYAEEKR